MKAKMKGDNLPQSMRIAFIFCILLTLSLLCSAALGQSAEAQSAPVQVTTEEQTRSLLTQKVHLKLGATTLSAIMKALSEQTGLQIEATSYLREHRLTVYMDNVSAITAIMTLCELNDWKWQILKPGQIMLGFPQAKTPQQLTDVSLALQSAMPKDFRRFLGSPGTLRSAMYLPTKPALKTVGPVQEPPKSLSFRAGDMPRMHSDNQERGQTLLDLLKPRILDQKPIPYKQLNPEQQRKLPVRSIG